MTPTPVGMRCPECAKQRTRVQAPRAISAQEPRATYVLIAINVLVFFGASTSIEAQNDLLLFDSGVYFIGGPEHGVAGGEWWLLLTSGFLHTEYWHIGMNMLSLYWLGRLIEPALGHARFVAIYLTSLFTGSLVVLAFQPDVETLGASGAVYGLLGAAVVMARNRNIDLVQSGLLPILVLNLGLTLLLSRNNPSGITLSLGGHVGGLIGGFVATFFVEEIARRWRSSLIPGVLACGVIGLAAAVGSIALA